MNNTGRRILVNVKDIDYFEGCDGTSGPGFDDYTTDYYTITEEDYYNGDTFTRISSFEDVSYVGIDIRGSSYTGDYDSELEFEVIDGDTGEVIQYFPTTACMLFTIDATSSCPSGANILIKTYCASPANCNLGTRRTYTSAADGCPKTIPPSPAPDSITPSSDDGNSSNGAAVVGGIVGGVILLGALGGIAALLIIRKRRQERGDVSKETAFNTWTQTGSPLPPGTIIMPGSDPDAGGMHAQIPPPQPTGAEAYAWATSPPPESAGESRAHLYAANTNGVNENFFPINPGMSHLSQSTVPTSATGASTGSGVAAAGGVVPAVIPASSSSVPSQIVSKSGIDSAASAGSPLMHNASGTTTSAVSQDPLLEYVSTHLTNASTRTQSSDLASWELCFEDLKMGRTLGEGSWGRVYKAQYRETDVAVKVLLNDDKMITASNAESLLSMTNSVMSRLNQEASIMANLHHPHVIHLLGLTTFPAAMVQEYCERGSLLDVLRSAKTDQSKADLLTWDRRIYIAAGVAKGMLYLHSLNPPLVHRDLKSANILLTTDWCPKVADFGLSKIMSDTARSSSLTAMNPRWMAPELLTGGLSAPSADVFAFGVVLWELMTWELPWGMTNPWGIVGALERGERPAIPQAAELPGPGSGTWPQLGDYIDLIRCCWSQDVGERPNFQEVILKLRALASKAENEAS